MAARRQQAQAQRREVGIGRLQRGRVEDLADEDVQVSRRVGLVRQPLQFGRDRLDVLAQQGGEHGQGGAQAAQAHPHLVQGLGPPHPPQQFGIGRGLAQGGQGRAAQGLLGGERAGQGIGGGVAGRALGLVRQTPAALGLALEQGDQRDVGRQAPGQGEQGFGRAVLQLQLQFAQGLGAAARRQFALVMGGLDHGPLEGDQASAAAHRAGETGRQVATAAFQQGGDRRGLQRLPVQGLARDRRLPFGAAQYVAARLALQRLDAAASRGPHAQAPARAAQRLVGGVEIDGAQILDALLARQRRVGGQARGAARPKPELEFDFHRRSRHPRRPACRPTGVIVAPPRGGA
ncbi:hypothetical protein D3C77_301690 [compost metagenome]